MSTQTISWYLNEFLDDRTTDIEIRQTWQEPSDSPSLT